MRSLIITAVAALALLAGCGGDQLGAEAAAAARAAPDRHGWHGGTGPARAAPQTYSMGNGSGSSFQSGMIGLSSANVSAGGTTSLTLTVVDQNGVLYTAAPVVVSYSSTCISSGLAIDRALGYQHGRHHRGYDHEHDRHHRCHLHGEGLQRPGRHHRDRGGRQHEPDGDRARSPWRRRPSARSSSYRPHPASIGLKGTGLERDLHGDLQGRRLDRRTAARRHRQFHPEHERGGISLSPSTAVSAADGTVQTVVSSGTEHTVGSRDRRDHLTRGLSTQSSALTVTTGLPTSGALLDCGRRAASYGLTTLACPNVEATASTSLRFPSPCSLPIDTTTRRPTTPQSHSRQTAAASPAAARRRARDARQRSMHGQLDQLRANPAAEHDEQHSGGLQKRARADSGDGHRRGVLRRREQQRASTKPATRSRIWASRISTPTRAAPTCKGDHFDNYYNTGSYVGPSGSFIGITCTSTSCTEATLGIGVEHLMVMSTSGAVALMTVSPPFSTAI